MQEQLYPATRVMSPIDPDTIEALCKNERTGRPLGDRSFIEEVEKTTGRRMKIRKPGPKPKIRN